jgi:5'-phosphate synthase pdxT subunit
MMATESPLRIGILALQGGVAEHAGVLRRLGIAPVDVRLPEHLRDLDGIIIPGGESTTIGKLMAISGLAELLAMSLRQGMPAYGTCAGMILLARRLSDGSQPVLGVMDIRVRRNAYGDQSDSFESSVRVSGIGDEPVRAVFIRAPVVEQIGPSVQVLAALADGTPIVVREGALLASAFHPELAGETRLHHFFAEMCRRPA